MTEARIIHGVYLGNLKMSMIDCRADRTSFTYLYVGLRGQSGDEIKPISPLNESVASRDHCIQ